MDIQKMMMEEREKLLVKWQPFLEGIDNDYIAGNTALLLENEARYLAEAPTQASDVVGLQKIMLPIVRRVFPNLIANNLVSVQPIAAPAGIIFYLRYIFGTQRPGVTPTGVGDEFSMYEDTAGQMAGYNPWYSTDEIGPYVATGANVANNGTVATPGAAAQYTQWPLAGSSAFFGTIEELNADGSVAAVFSFSFDAGYPLPGSISLGNFGNPSNTGLPLAVTQNSQLPAGTYPGYNVRPADKLQVTTNYTVSVANNTGIVTVTNATGAAVAGLKVSAWYKTNLEYSTAIPEMKITISSIPVAVKTRKLKAMWSQESEQDLKAYHGLSADAELTALVSNEMIAEIDREIIQKCLTIAPATSRMTHNYSAFAGNNVTGNFLDSHLAIMQKVTVLSNEIFRKSKIGPANWIVTGTKVASYIEVLKGFIPNPVTASMGMNIVKAGTYAGKFDIYKDPMFPDDKMLMGHKSPASPFGAGLVYSPYVTNLTPVLVGQDDFNPRRGFLARYGLTQVPFGQLLYGVLSITNLPGAY
jgi:hypothetical protein